MSDLIDTTEMYLKTIFELEEEGTVPLRARIAQRLQQSGPTVSQTVARMERDGLVVVSGDRHLEFTALGRERATQVMRKHRLAERLLIDVIGLEWEYVHDEACRWEHVMSERVERRLLDLLHAPEEDPYGNPIPGLAAIGGVDVPDTLDGLQTLVAAASATPVEVQVRRVGEPAQADLTAMLRLSALGLRPGSTVQVSRVAGGVLVGEPGEVLSDDVAVHVFVVSV
ncbi:iron (metal) dependent repressor, DtxR family [Quadrisphaera granulorum]|uniref:DtxR family iron (Metal) dependent repressor n=1 Tax=Quadrisphaera granulorum TaxID=317664 RepID=A0A316AD68_9ACTN|nr:metal-dependent transcriptional regulator [Quadrisphaera granulorum]PWJ55188.1 DtxR family iron (metal) dependent repressor [Quadrisphaera granulorum]SZE95697.1 iron (metal) dependent repressor, DtxR family [Quadrisphaera granulorum]